jgi:hypothetical protein
LSPECDRCGDNDDDEDGADDIQESAVQTDDSHTRWRQSRGPAEVSVVSG